MLYSVHGIQPRRLPHSPPFTSSYPCQKAALIQHIHVGTTPLHAASRRKKRQYPPTPAPSRVQNFKIARFVHEAHGQWRGALLVQELFVYLATPVRRLAHLPFSAPSVQTQAQQRTQGVSHEQAGYTCNPQQPNGLWEVACYFGAGYLLLIVMHAAWLTYALPPALTALQALVVSNVLDRLGGQLLAAEEVVGEDAAHMGRRVTGSAYVTICHEPLGIPNFLELVHVKVPAHATSPYSVSHSRAGAVSHGAGAGQVSVAGGQTLLVCKG